MTPTSESTYDRARRLASFEMWTIDLQCRRLQSSEPEDKVFLLRKWADFDFLVVALTRLRRIVKLASDIPEIHDSLSGAVSQFDATLPHLKMFRDVAEHVDDYALDRGRQSSVDRKQLETSGLSDNGLTLDWLGHQLNANIALKASRELFDALTSVSSAVPRDSCSSDLDQSTPSQ